MLGWFTTGKIEVTLPMLGARQAAGKQEMGNPGPLPARVAVMRVAKDENRCRYSNGGGGVHLHVNDCHENGGRFGHWFRKGPLPPLTPLRQVAQRQ